MAPTPTTQRGIITSRINFGQKYFIFNEISYEIEMPSLMNVIGKSTDEVAQWRSIQRNQPSIDWVHPIEVKQHCILWGANELAKKVAKIAGLSKDEETLEQLDELFV